MSTRQGPVNDRTLHKESECTTYMRMYRNLINHKHYSTQHITKQPHTYVRMYVACKSGVCSSDAKADQKSCCWQCACMKCHEQQCCMLQICSCKVGLASAVVIALFYRRTLPHNPLKVLFTLFELALYITELPATV